MDFSSASQCKGKDEKEGMGGREEDLVEARVARLVYSRKCLWYVFGPFHCCYSVPTEMCSCYRSEHALVIFGQLHIKCIPCDFYHL